MRWGLLIFIFLLWASDSYSMEAYLYTKQTAQPNTSLSSAVTEAKVESALDDSLRAYLKAGSQTWASLTTPLEFYEGSRFFVGPGIQYIFPTVSLSAELRGRRNLGDSEVTWDFVGVGILEFNDRWQFPVDVITADSFFIEGFSETLFTSGIDNVTHETLARLGLRTSLGIEGYWDVFTEPAITADRLGIYSNNTMELRFGTQVGWTWSQYSLELSARYAFSRYYRFTDFDHEYPDPQSGFRLALSFLAWTE